MTFAQQWNRQMTHFSECILIIKWRTTVLTMEIQMRRCSMHGMENRSTV